MEDKQHSGVGAEMLRTTYAHGCEFHDARRARSEQHSDFVHPTRRIVCCEASQWLMIASAPCTCTLTCFDGLVQTGWYDGVVTQ